MTCLPSKTCWLSWLFPNKSSHIFEKYQIVIGMAWPSVSRAEMTERCYWKLSPKSCTSRATSHRMHSADWSNGVTTEYWLAGQKDTCFFTTSSHVRCCCLRNFPSLTVWALAVMLLTLIWLSQQWARSARCIACKLEGQIYVTTQNW